VSCSRRWPRSIAVASEAKLYTAMIDIAERRLEKKGLAKLLLDLKEP
jgi:hypothetical protein